MKTNTSVIPNTIDIVYLHLAPCQNNTALMDILQGGVCYTNKCLQQHVVHNSIKLNTLRCTIIMYDHMCWWDTIPVDSQVTTSYNYVP